jgi:DNA polymerase-3 subunit epsilon
MLGIDTETTGLDRLEDRIVSFAAVFQGGEESEIGAIIDPGMEIPEGAAKVHGITTERARNEGVAPEVGVQALVSAISIAMQTRMPIVVFNAPFDLTMLREEALRHLGMPRTQWDGVWPVYDPMVVDKQLDPYRKGRRTLEATAAAYGIPFAEADKHTAMGDVRVMLAIARKQLAKAPAGTTFEQLHHDQAVWKASQAANFRQYLLKQGKPADDVVGDWPFEKYVEPAPVEAGGVTW